MSDDHKDAVFSEEQIHELEDLRRKLQLKKGERLDDPDVWYRCHISNYVTLISVAEVLRKSSDKGAASRAKETDKLRRDCLTAFRSRLKRDPVADDVLAELSKVAIVPDYLSRIIMADFKE